MLIVLSGMPGTGKSTLAEGIARARRSPVLSVDPIESAILGAGIPASFETGLAAYLIAETLADEYLAVGLDPIIDAVNSVEPARDQWRRLAVRHGTELRILVCVISDPGLHANRLAGRDRGLRLGEPTAAAVEARRAEWTDWPEPHLILDALDDVGANLARALDFLG